MTYNLSLINTTGILPLTQSVNSELMYGLFGVLTLLTIFMVTLISFRANNIEFKSSFSYSLTIIAVLSIPLSLLGLVASYVVWTCIVALGVSVAMLFFTD